MRPEIQIITRLPDAVRARKWGVSATLAFGFCPLNFLIDDLYGGSLNLGGQKYEDLVQEVNSEGLASLDHKDPPLFLVKKTKDASEITQLARKLVRFADQCLLEDLVLDHYRMLGFSKSVNPELTLPLLQGLRTTPTVTLKRVHIFADQDTYGGKNHTRDWTKILDKSITDLALD